MEQMSAPGGDELAAGRRIRSGFPGGDAEPPADGPGVAGPERQDDADPPTIPVVRRAAGNVTQSAQAGRDAYLVDGDAVIHVRND